MFLFQLLLAKLILVKALQMQPQLLILCLAAEIYGLLLLLRRQHDTFELTSHIRFLSHLLFRLFLAAIPAEANFLHAEFTDKGVDFLYDFRLHEHELIRPYRALRREKKRLEGNPYRPDMACYIRSDDAFPIK